MTEPIRIPLSVHQQARFAAFHADAKRLQERLDDTVTGIIAGQVDPTSVQGWSIQLMGDAIVCTPPAVRDESVVGQIETAAP